jgi:hypothetical protein
MDQPALTGETKLELILAFMLILLREITGTGSPLSTRSFVVMIPGPLWIVSIYVLCMFVVYRSFVVQKLWKVRIA